MYHTTGLTKAQIAELRAKIASREIKPGMRLENIYERLHVSSRTAAVTRAFPDRVV